MNENDTFVLIEFKKRFLIVFFIFIITIRCGHFKDVSVIPEHTDMLTFY